MALDFFKNISSKLTVNSLLKIDMMSFGVETIELEGIIYPHFKGGLKQITLMRAKQDLASLFF
ncbi:MAG: phage tail protein [Anaplasmataceae bacterium]|nr:phage tail protein [Candidatus Heimdallarchaeota archaeon]MDH5796848.1 phage tail protein [Anaplasmataceae bacterium]